MVSSSNCYASAYDWYLCPEIDERSPFATFLFRGLNQSPILTFMQRLRDAASRYQCCRKKSNRDEPLAILRCIDLLLHEQRKPCLEMMSHFNNAS